MPIHSGSWFGLPDLGITEKVQSVVAPKKQVASSGGSNLFGGSPPRAAQSQSVNYGNQNFQVPQILGAKTSSGNFTPTTSTNTNQSSFNQGVGQINQQQDNGFSQIESDYAQAMSMFDSQESGLRGQADTAGGQIENEASKAKNEIVNNQAVAEGAANTSLQSAEKQGTSAMQQARDLFRQTQQSNIAQLSALGISSSSVSEALAERLGVETARRIAGVTGSLNEVRDNTVKELGRIKTYYQGKIADVQNQVQVQKANIQNALVQGLNQINSGRQKASSDKASARANLLSEAQNQIFQLTQQQQQFEQSLKAWSDSKTAALQPIITDENFINTLTSATNTFNNKFAPTGFSYAPEVNTDAYGNVKGQVSYNLKKKEDDLALAAPTF